MLLKTFMAKFRLSPVKSSESTSWYVLDGEEKKKKGICLIWEKQPVTVCKVSINQNMSVSSKVT